MGAGHRQSKTLADRLGVKPDQRVRLVGAVDRALIGAGREVASGQADVVFLALDSSADLALIGPLQDTISPRRRDLGHQAERPG